MAQAKFNGTSLIGGSDANKTIQTGADDGDTTTLTLAGINSDTLNVTDSDVNFVGKETATFDTFADANQATGDKFTLTTDAIAGSSKTYITAAAGAGGFADNAAIAAGTANGCISGIGWWYRCCFSTDNGRYQQLWRYYNYLRIWWCCY